MEIRKVLALMHHRARPRELDAGGALKPAPRPLLPPRRRETRLPVSAILPPRSTDVRRGALSALAAAAAAAPGRVLGVRRSLMVECPPGSGVPRLSLSLSLFGPPPPWLPPVCRAGDAGGGDVVRCWACTEFRRLTIGEPREEEREGGGTEG